MSQTRHRPDEMTPLEYDRLESTITDRLVVGERVFDAAELVEATGVSIEEVYQAMLHSERTNEHITEVAAGKWEIEGPDE